MIDVWQTITSVIELFYLQIHNCPHFQNSIPLYSLGRVNFCAMITLNTHHSLAFLFYGINLILNKTESKQYHSIAVIKNMWSVVLSDRTSMLNSPWIAFFDKMYNACSFLECTCSYFLSNGVHTWVVKAFGKWDCLFDVQICIYPLT